MRKNWFEPNYKYAFLFGMSVFDACWKKSKKLNGYEQAYPDLESVQDDCEQILQCLDKYGFKKRNVFNLSDNPTRRDVEYALNTITKMLRTGKKKKPLDKYLVIFLFAGHGLMVEGQ